MWRRLTRSRNAMIGGVAAGVAEWLNIDPAIVRIAWAILVPLTSGAALLAYLVAWALLPEEPATSSSGVVDESSPESGAGRSAPAMDEGRTALLLGGALIIIGLWFLVRELLPDIDWGFVWPLALMAAGIVVLVNARRR